VETGGSANATSFMVFGPADELQAYRDLVAAFEADQPGQRVDLITIPSRDDYHRRLAADFGAGRAADVILVDYRRFPGYASRGLLEPVAPYLAQSQVLRETDFYRETLFPYYYGRDMVCLPQHGSGLAVYYNKALFDAAGVAYPGDRWDWEDFTATAAALTRDTNGDGIVDVYGVGTEVSLTSAVPFIWQNQGELVDNLLLPRLMEISQPLTVQAVQWFGGWQTDLRAAPDAAAEAAESSEARFMSGRLAMYLNTRRGVAAYRPLAGLDWDVAPLPGHRGRRTNVLFSDGYCLSASARDKAAAWRFIEFASTLEGQGILAATGRMVPSRPDAAEAALAREAGSRPEHGAVFLNSIERLQPVPALENWVEIDVIVSDEIQNVFYGRSPASAAMRVAALRAEEYLRFHNTQ
jgi:multiple sugar transport system substrate-binding protein